MRDAPAQAANILEAYFDVEDGEVENLAPTVDAHAGTYSFGGAHGGGAPPPGNGGLPGAGASGAAHTGGFDFGTPMS